MKIDDFPVPAISSHLVRGFPTHQQIIALEAIAKKKRSMIYLSI